MIFDPLFVEAIYVIVAVQPQKDFPEACLNNHNRQETAA